MKPHQFFASDPLLWRLQRPHGAQAARPRCESMAFGVLWTREGQAPGPNQVIFHWIYEVVHRFSEVRYCNIFFTMSVGFTTLEIATLFFTTIQQEKNYFITSSIQCQKDDKDSLNLPPFYWDLFAKCCIFLGLLQVRTIWYIWVVPADSLCLSTKNTCQL